MKKSSIILAALCALALCSCNKEQPLSSEGNGTPLVFKARMGEYSLKAGLDKDNFNVGDKIGLFASFNSEYDECNTCLTATRNASTFEADHNIYWNDWELASADSWGWAYFPYDASRTIPGVEGWEVYVNADQSTDEKYIASDFRVAGLDMKPLHGEVDMPFLHIFSKVLFHVTNDTGKQISDLYLSNVYGKAMFYSINEEPSPTGSTGTVKACRFEDGENGVQQWAAIIPPQYCCPELIITTSDQKQYSFEIKEPEDFYCGVQRDCYIHLTENTAVAGFSDEVTSWTDDRFYNFDNKDRIILDILDPTVMEKLISLGYDTNADGRISKSEALMCTSLDLSGTTAHRIIGLEEFDNLKTLILDGTYVDPSCLCYLPENLEALSLNGCVNVEPVLDFAADRYASRIKKLQARSCPGLKYVNAEGMTGDCVVDVTDSPVSHVISTEGVTLVQNSGAELRPFIWCLVVYTRNGSGVYKPSYYPFEQVNGDKNYWMGTADLTAGSLAAFIPNFSDFGQVLCPYSSEGNWPVNVWSTLSDGYNEITVTGKYELQLDLNDGTCYTHFELTSYDAIVGAWHAEALSYFGESFSWDMKIEEGQYGLVAYNVEPFVGSYGYTGPVSCTFNGVNIIIPDLQFLGMNSAANIYLSGNSGDIVMALKSDGTLVLQSYLGSAAGVDAGDGNVSVNGYYNMFAPGVVFTKQ